MVSDEKEPELGTPLSEVHRIITGEDPISDEERLIAEAALDPVTWCESHLQDPENPEKALSFRSYQKDMIRWQPTREWSEEDKRHIWRNRVKLYRCGRRVGKSVVTLAELVWLCATNKNFRAMLITPFEQQMVTAFETIQNMIALHVTAKLTRNPYKITFSNGSIVHGLIAGVKSAKKIGRGSSARGEGARAIFVIEMDHGIDHALEAIIPIMAGKEDCRWVGDSTPSGQRGIFFSWCRKGVQHGYKEFHMPSHVSPEWNSETERLMKEMFPLQAVYNREILAEFGEPTSGIFKAKDLEVCAKDYTYDEITRNLKNELNDYCTYSMGVDWNQTYGVKIYIVELNERTGHFRTIFKMEVPNTQYTQTNAVREIIRLSAIYPLTWIYVDKGFGTTQVELLHKHGKDNPDTHLDKIVKTVDFKGTVILKDPSGTSKDPATQKQARLIKKPLKEFCVANAARMVETHAIDIPVFEDHKEGLIGQMRGYQQEITPAGNAIYIAENRDDLLVAWMLAILAFTLERGEFSRYDYATTFRHIKDPQHIGRQIQNRTSEIEDPVSKSILGRMHIPGLKVKKFRRVVPGSKIEAGPGADTIGIGHSEKIRNILRRRGLGGRSNF